MCSLIAASLLKLCIDDPYYEMQFADDNSFKLMHMTFKYIRKAQLISENCLVFTGFWPTVLSVEPLVHCVVCLSVICLSVCDVLYCGKTVRPSEKLSEGVNRKPGQKVDFLGRRHISTSGFAATATETVVFALFLLV